MREMKDSGVAWIGEIPEEWDLLRFKDHYKNIKEVAGEKSFEYDRLALTLNGVIKRKKDDSDGLQPKEFDGYQILRKNDFIFKMIDLQNISTSRVGLSQYTGLVSPAYIRFTPRKKDSFNKFVYYYLMSMYYNCVFNNLGGNGVRSALNASDMGRLMIPYPKIETQHQIATYLDQKCTQIDALITNQQKQIEKLKAYKQSLITETVTKGLNPDVPMKDSSVEWIGEIPEDWEIVRIKNICQFNPSSKKSFSDDDIVSYAPMECVRTGSLVHKEIAIKNVSSGLTYFEENDIIMAKVTPCFENGNIAIATGLTKGMAFGSSELFVFRANESIKFFLFYFLQNNIFKKFSISTMTGTGGLKRVSSNFVNNYSFALPPIEERNKIVFYLDKKCTQIDSLIAIKQRKIEKLQQYKKSVIYEYVTGKKEVK